MSYKIAGAPCCWGVESADNEFNPHWYTVLRETQEAGFKGLELGPYGFLPLDSDIITPKLHALDLQICAGTIYDPLSVPEMREAVLAKTRKLCGILQQLDTKLLVVIDAVCEARNPYAGLPEEAPRLSDERWVFMMDTIRQIAAIAKQHGVRAVVHPHAGGYIEFKDETDRMLTDLSHEEVGLCLDTGHLYYACQDPAQSLIEYKDRLDYVHFKDVQADVYKQVVNERIGFFAGCARSVMCRLVKGYRLQSRLHGIAGNSL
ncbi:inosose dehydratase [Photobacterium aphoticum]|uniref:Inosose dehydratase n=1 Tax=Photobacterium aphoticum TaxID=754436 RepID=A0A090QNU4_9GAMM|nr:inosose dehydratase [Photobacterium aphoticum]